jgi:glutamyl-tRNA synthetase/glutamyl-Q tRNA(Asp) synthetase
MLGEETVEFNDIRLGHQQQSPAQQCGDLLLRDATGNWTYQLSVTVDDARQGITLVIRGEDLLASTGRQILLGRMLGREAPAVFLHHPLIVNEQGAKLSKRDRATGIRELRAAGLSPESVLGEAAWRTGLLPELRPVRVSELPDLFR